MPHARTVDKGASKECALLRVPGYSIISPDPAGDASMSELSRAPAPRAITQGTGVGAVDGSLQHPDALQKAERSSVVKTRNDFHSII